MGKESAVLEGVIYTLMVLCDISYFSMNSLRNWTDRIRPNFHMFLLNIPSEVVWQVYFFQFRILKKTPLFSDVEKILENLKFKLRNSKNNESQNLTRIGANSVDKMRNECQI